MTKLIKNSQKEKLETAINLNENLDLPIVRDVLTLKKTIDNLEDEITYLKKCIFNLEMISHKNKDLI
tara:strand:+ start:950 stop:1150 length:201 start_codon:yes stop_codon:yes gene_type:complete